MSGVRPLVFTPDFRRWFWGVTVPLLLIVITAGLLAWSDPLNSQQPERQVENTAFGRGEVFVFRAMYYSRVTGNVTAGEASLRILPERVMVGGQPTMKIVGQANTRGVFNWFFTVENLYESYLQEEYVAPVRFYKTIREGRYRRNADIWFDLENSTATTPDTVVHTSPFVQDIISAFYYARTFDVESARPGDSFELELFHRDTVYVSRILFEGREQITTSLGTFNTLRFKPQVLEGAVFSQPYPMTLWISDDKNKMPVRAESGLVVGRARLDLVEFGGLRNSVTSFIP